MHGISVLHLTNTYTPIVIKFASWHCDQWEHTEFSISMRGFRVINACNHSAASCMRITLIVIKVNLIPRLSPEDEWGVHTHPQGRALKRG